MLFIVAERHSSTPERIKRCTHGIPTRLCMSLRLEPGILLGVFMPRAEVAGIRRASG
jgi:hypothetical protein